MADNLNITIGADTSKFRADLKLAEAALRDLIKQERLLAQEAQRTGERGKLDAITPSVVAAEKAVRSFRRELYDTGSAMDVLAQRSTRRLLTQFNSLSRTTQNIATVVGGLAGGFAGGFLAGAVVKGVQQLSDSLANVNAELIRVRDLGREIGAKPMAIQAFGEIAKEAGGSASDAEKAITGVAQAFEKFRTTAGAAVTGGVQVMRGSLARTADAAKEVTSNFQSGVAVLRGSAPLVFDLANSYEMLGIKLGKYKATQEGQLKLTIDTFAAFQRAAQQKTFDPIQLNAMSKFLFGGVPADSMLKIIPGEIDKLTAKLKELAGAPRGIKADDIIAQEELDKAKTRMDKIFADVFASLNRQNVASQTAINNLFADFLGTTLPSFFSSVGEAFAAGWKNFNDNLVTLTGDTLDQLLSRWQGYFSSFIDMLGKAANAAASLLPKIGGSPATGSVGEDFGGGTASGFAGGGFVRGAGSGTSDSILARLSNGEFVMRASAVDHWGPRFLASLNNLRNPFGYALGGLVDSIHAPVPGFAEGGLVTAGGTPVHLHLGGHSFALSGRSDIVGELVAEAGRQQMRSAGIKPSWYGGRPGGR